MAIAEDGGEITFLYKIAPGSTEKSFGVYAAKLAGLPRPVVRRAEELLREYEDRDGVTEEELAAYVKTSDLHGAQGSAVEARLVTELLKLDLNSLSPVEALMKLFELRQTAEREQGTGVTALQTA